MECEKIEFDIPVGVLKICKILKESGEDGFLVGGSVRDLLRGKEPGDFDLATTATPEKLMKLFRRVIPTGIDHGTVTVLMADDAFEVTTLRSEQGYSDGRHPDSVKYVTHIDDDLSRRDFTVNAIAWNPVTFELCDPFDGRADLREKCLRAVGDARARFEEDGLRIMRAARFASTLQFEIEGKTLQALSEKRTRLNCVSVERKRDELQKLLLAEVPSFGLRVMVENSIFFMICPANDFDTSDDSWQALYQRVDEVPPLLHLRLAALFLHIPGSTMDEWMDRYLIDKRTKKRAAALHRCFPVKYDPSWSDAEVRTVLSKIGRENYDDFRALQQADANSGNRDSAAAMNFVERVRELDGLNGPLSVADLAISGVDLMSLLNIAPGRHIGELLQRLLQFVLDFPACNTREHLLQRARELDTHN